MEKLGQNSRKLRGYSLIMKSVPDKIYGICPIGHNPRPSGTTGNDISTTQIPEGEGRELFWSNYYQKYVCKMHINRVEDKKNELPFHERQLEIQRKLSGMGFVNQMEE